MIHTFFLKHESQALRLRLLYRDAGFGSLGIANTQNQDFELALTMGIVAYRYCFSVFYATGRTNQAIFR